MSSIYRDRTALVYAALPNSAIFDQGGAPGAAGALRRRALRCRARPERDTPRPGKGLIHQAIVQLAGVASRPPSGRRSAMASPA